MDFKTYMNSSNNSNSSTYDNAKEEDFNKAYEKYGKMTRQEMMQALFREVNSKRQAGTFDIASIRDFYKRIAPMLGEGERATMRGIIEELERL